MKKLQRGSIFLLVAGIFFTTVSAPCTVSASASGETTDESVSGDPAQPDRESRVGWCKIGKAYYYFNKKGVMQKNKIVGDKKKGYYYVDASGVRVTDRVTRTAVAFVRKHSNSGQSKKQRLKSCYNALCKYPYKRFYGDHPGAKEMPSYASYMFKNKKGNCYRYTAAMAYIARVLGFDSRVSIGGVSSRRNGSLNPHGWCEVKIGGKWKICDCSMRRVNKNKTLFLLEWKKYPYRIRRDKKITMQVKKGKVSWKNIS